MSFRHKRAPDLHPLHHSWLWNSYVISRLSCTAQTTHQRCAIT